MKTGDHTLPTSWSKLTSLEQLEEAEKESFERPVVLFKDSVTCGISAYAKERLQEFHLDGTCRFYYLDLLSYRDISNEIANRYGVIHQSPQVIILKNGKASFSTSHHQISPEIIKKNLN